MLAKVGADTAENEQPFAEILPIRRPGLPPVAVAPGEVAPRGLLRELLRHLNRGCSALRSAPQKLTSAAFESTARSGFSIFHGHFKKKIRNTMKNAVVSTKF